MALVGQPVEWLSQNGRYRLLRRLYHRYEAVAPPALFLGGTIALVLLDRHNDSLLTPL
jgi:hypothetical protein